MSKIFGLLLVASFLAACSPGSSGNDNVDSNGICTPKFTNDSNVVIASLNTANSCKDADCLKASSDSVLNECKKFKSNYASGISCQAAIKDEKGMLSKGISSSAIIYEQCELVGKNIVEVDSVCTATFVKDYSTIDKIAEQAVDACEDVASRQCSSKLGELQFQCAQFTKKYNESFTCKAMVDGQKSDIKAKEIHDFCSKFLPKQDKEIRI